MKTETHTLETFDHLKLHLQSLKRSTTDKWIIVTHGVGEHHARHDYWFGDEFKDYSVLLWDLRGHGDSTGERAFVQNFDDFVKDLDSVIAFTQEKLGMKTFVLFGHSMGGLIVSRWIATRPDAKLYPEKVILSAPGAGAHGKLGVLTHNIPDFLYDKLIKLPSVPLGGILDLKKMSHKEGAYERYVNDPKMILRVHTHLFFELLKKAKHTFSKPLNPRCPMLVIMGSEDVIVNIDLIRKYFRTTETKAEFVEIENGYHELYKESDEYFKPFIAKLKSFLAA